MKNKTLVVLPAIALIGIFITIKYKFQSNTISLETPLSVYQLNEQGKLELTPVQEASSEAEPSGIESAQTIASPLPEDTFESLSTLENYEAGYRFVYPSGFTITYEFGRVFFNAPQPYGHIVAYIKPDKTLKTEIRTKSTDSQELPLLQAADAVINAYYENINNQISIDKERFE